MLFEISNLPFRKFIYGSLLLAVCFPANSQTNHSDTNPSASDPQTTEQPSAPKSTQKEAYPDTSGDLVHYPGIGPTSHKVETTIGGYKLRFYGTLLVNFSYSDNIVVGEDLPLWAISGSSTVTFPDGTTTAARNVHDGNFSARQSILGFTLQGTQGDESWRPSGVVEFDFFGSRPVDTLQPQSRVFNQPRLRLAYAQMEKGNWRFVAGQDNAIIAPLDPVSLSHVAAPLAATAGNLWARLPQARVDYTAKMDDTTATLQFGVLRPEFGDPRLNDLPTSGSSVDATSAGFGTRSSQPFYEARVALAHPWNESNASIGFGGHYGRERVGSTRTLESWATALDWTLPVFSRLTFRGEAYAGSNLTPFQGGIEQGVAILQPVANGPVLRVQRIGDGGGWGEAIIPITSYSRDVFYAGASTDDPKDSNLLPGTGRAKNSMVWASIFHKFTDQTTLAFEWSNWDFRTRAFVNNQPAQKLPTGRANVFDASFAFQF